MHSFLAPPTYTHRTDTKIDEWSIPNKCNEICQNFDGDFNCTGCSHGKEYDPKKNKCVMSAKQRNLILGESCIYPSKLNTQNIHVHI
jgi:hypothetical protein